jgi:peptide/nickel transport system substrate-binding protein
MIKIRLIGVLALLLLTFCKPAPHIQNEVRVRLPQDPESVNPISYRNIHGLQIISLLFQSLLSTTGTEAQLKPLLAESVPSVRRLDSAVHITYRLRPEARWDNGSAVTAEDISLSMKLIKCPLLDNEKLRMRYEAVQDVWTDASESATVTFICDKNTPDPVRLTGSFFVLPAHVFDPQELLKRFTIHDLTTRFDSLKEAPVIKEYAAWFNGESLSRESFLFNGSGGYKLSSWKTGQSLTMEKKVDWWAEKLSGQSDYITANPTKINFQIIPENSTALRALKDNAIDIYSNIPANDFIQLIQDPEFKKNFTYFTPETYDFTYIGINSRSEKFADRTTRQALAYLLDVQTIIQVTQQNFASQTSGPLKPNDPFYNTKIRGYHYDPKKASLLLQQAGWQNKEGQWIKVVNEEKIPLTVNLQYKAGNTDYENIALIFKQAANQINIPVEIQAVEGNTLSENLRSHNFDMFIRGISGSPGEYDFKSILHTESAVEGGNNYTGFGTDESDAVIEAINHATDEASKAKYLNRFQEILYEEACTIFLYTVKNRIAVHNRLTNIQLTASKYGFDVTAFTLSNQ